MLHALQTQLLPTQQVFYPHRWRCILALHRLCGLLIPPKRLHMHVTDAPLPLQLHLRPLWGAGRYRTVPSKLASARTKRTFKCGAIYGLKSL